MIRAPNQQSVPAELQPFKKRIADINHYFASLALKIPVGPPDALLAVSVLEPGDYKFDWQLKTETESKPGGTPAKETVSFHFSALDKSAAPVPPKGTIVLLHGIMMSKESMLHWGFFLAQKGYRMVLVDLRGHGESTGDTISFGARETRDLSQVLDELVRRRVAAGRVGVLGISYGGAIAIQWAARDPRIAGLVALEPFSDAREAIGQFAHALMPEVIKHVSEETMTGAFALTAQRGGFTWDESDVIAAAHRLRTPVLLIHGANDTWIPISHSERILAVAPAGSRLLRGQGNHLTLSLRLDPIAEPVSAWFDQALTAP